MRATILAISLLALAWPRQAGAEDASPQAADDLSRVRFEALASVKSDSTDVSGTIAEAPVSPAVPPKPNGTFVLTTKIAAHSAESNFLGIVPVRFAGIDVQAGAPFTTFWTETACHQDHGYPHIEVPRLEGTIVEAGNAFHIIDAERSTLGRRIPPDRLYLDTRASALDTTDKVARLKVIKTLFFRTAQSHLLIEVRLSRFRC